MIATLYHVSSYRSSELPYVEIPIFYLPLDDISAYYLSIESVEFPTGPIYEGDEIEIRLKQCLRLKLGTSGSPVTV